MGENNFQGGTLCHTPPACGMQHADGVLHRESGIWPLCATRRQRVAQNLHKIMQNRDRTGEEAKFSSDFFSSPMGSARARVLVPKSSRIINTNTNTPIPSLLHQDWSSTKLGKSPFLPKFGALEGKFENHHFSSNFWVFLDEMSCS